MWNEADRRLDRSGREGCSNPSPDQRRQDASDPENLPEPGRDAALAARLEASPPGAGDEPDPEAVYQDRHGSYDSDGRRILTDRQRRAIEFTVEGATDTWIAQTLGVTRQTLWNWKTRDQDYRYLLDEARQQARTTASDRIQRLLIKAAKVLDRHLDDDRSANQFKAAHVILTMAVSYKPPPRDPEERQPEPRLGPKVG